MPWIAPVIMAAAGTAGALASRFGGGRFDFDARPYEFDPKAFKNPYSDKYIKQFDSSSDRFKQPLDIRTQLDSQKEQRAARAQQQQFAQVMQNQALGKGGVSLAEMELRQNMAAAMQAQRSALASAPRGSSASLARQTATNMANLHLDQTNQGLMARAREQQLAQAQLGNLLAQTREGDLSGADIMNRGRIANQELQMRSDAQRAEFERQYLAMAMGQAETDRSALMQEQDMRAREHARIQGLQYDTSRIKNEQDRAFWGGVFGGGAQAGAMGSMMGGGGGGGQASTPLYSPSGGGGANPWRGISTRM